MTSSAPTRHRADRDRPKYRNRVCIANDAYIGTLNGGQQQAWSVRRRCRRVSALRSSFAGFRFPPDVITLAVRWCLRSQSYRDVEELLAERGITVD